MKRTTLVFLALTLLGLWGCSEQSAGSRVRIDAPIIVSPDSYRELQTLFDSINYTLGNLDRGVPRLVLTQLPEDMEHLNVISEKKKIFFLSLLPMVLIANEEIAQQRSRLLAIFEQHRQGEALSEADRQWLQKLT
ncbi:MAG: hypothetical protein GWN87_31475, partial [Desulfuromonadales bacterium]|nr:hypothetical protein [Desulfuromonadales bacterium]